MYVIAENEYAAGRNFIDMIGNMSMHYSIFVKSLPLFNKNFENASFPSINRISIESIESEKICKKLEKFHLLPIAEMSVWLEESK